MIQSQEPSLRANLGRLARYVGRRMPVGANRPPLELRNFGMHPLEAQAHAGDRRFVLDLPLADCRGHRSAAFPCVSDAGHPYLETARSLLARPDVPYEATLLARYYRCFQPNSAAAYLGIEPDKPALRARPECAVFPWEPPPPEAIAVLRRAELERENRSHGADLSFDHGFNHFGPTTPAKGMLEIARLTAILARLQAEGFRLLPGHSGLPRALFLVTGDDWRALITNGQHRIAAAAALGATTAPFWPLPKAIRREEAETWPAVAGGIFTLAQALEIFDRLFAGRQPAALDPAYWTA